MDSSRATPQQKVVDEAGRLDLVVPADSAGARIDRLLGQALAPVYSRSFVAALIEQGAVQVDGRRVRPSFRVEPGQRIAGELGGQPDRLPRAEPIPLAVLHVDEALIVVDKQAGLVIHPGTGATRGTLVNALLDRFPEVARVGRADRPGIVHRLDRDTTGVMVVARTNPAAASLVNQFKRKSVEKVYSAVVWGEPPFDSDWIDLPLGPHPHRPVLRAVLAAGGQASSTFYQVERRIGRLSLVAAQPRTGRTHQIRVHLEHIGFPIVCDPLYGRDSQLAYSRWVESRRREGRRVPVIARPALHARRLSLLHPLTGERVSFEAPLPADLTDLLEVAGLA
ncbi:MAG TPA: RluA family pseudouridine synthase, partial [Planctomycetota bacterium]|nr:RluA family pseudouridine synthase [Planctomycetota bacterium]